MDAQDHVLVVDDDAEIRALLRDYLQKNGYRVTVAADGRAMWAAFEAAKADIVVLDVMMPGDDGLTLCRDLRARWQIPVIMLTARGSASDRVAGLQAGADDYLPKPFGPDELVARIGAVLRRTQSFRPVGNPALFSLGLRCDSGDRLCHGDPFRPTAKNAP